MTQPPDRRSVLKLLAAAALPAAVGVSSSAPAQSAVLPGRAGRYQGEEVVVGHVVVSGRWTVDRLVVAPGAVLEFDSASSTVLRSRGNVVVRGTLRMRPRSAEVTHRLQFIHVEERRFRGGGMRVYGSDVGLWVVGRGRLDAQGTPRAAWNRTGADPSWRPGDEIRVAPSAAHDYTSFPRFVPGSPVPTFRHGSEAFATEVFNLTRNVVIGGTPRGRAHVMFLMTGPQRVSYVRVEYVGPRTADESRRGLDKTVPVLARYGMHFHHCRNLSRGTVVEGVVVAHSGSRAFVTHASHGVTWRSCIAYDVGQHAYWWDPDDKASMGRNATRDVLYDRCAAFKVAPRDKSERGKAEYRLSGFYLGQGLHNRAVGCVAAGVFNDRAPQTAGFTWPESANMKPSTWVVSGCTAHNNEKLGFFAWQNDPRQVNLHAPTGLTAWRNGETGIDHGAYLNTYRYSRLRSVGNGRLGSPKSAQLVIHPGSRNTFTDLTLDAAGMTDAAIVVLGHKSGRPTVPLRVVRADLSGYARWAVHYTSAGQPGWIDFVDCTVDGSRDLAPADFFLERFPPLERVRVQRRDGTAWLLRPDGSGDEIAQFAV